MEKEGVMIIVSDLAEDLRDAIVEYQVSNNGRSEKLNDSLMQFAVFSAEGDLRTKL